MSSLPTGPGWTGFTTYTTLNGFQITLASSPARPAPAVAAPVVTISPVTPNIDPKIDANALYGKPKLLFAGGLARIGAPGAPLVGPYISGGLVDLIVWLGYRVPIAGSAVLFDIALDNEIWWRANNQVTGGTQPSDGTFAEATAATFSFRQGTLTQTALSLETEKFGADANAYRPGMVLEIRNLPYQRFLDRSGKPVPYVSALIGDTTGGANPREGINLGTALTRIAQSPWARYTSDTFEAVGITDVVGAVLIRENFDVIDICRSITQAYPNIDLLVSDKVRIKDRGATVTPDIVLTRDTILGDDPLVIARAEATGMPRQEELVTVASDQDYQIGTALSQWPRDPVPVSAAVGKVTTTLPVAIDASTRQALAAYMRFARASDRKQPRLTATGAAYRAMPGDLIGITGLGNGVASQVLKLRSTIHAGNWCVEMGLGALLICRSGVPWTPSNTLLWLKGDNLTGSDGDNIATWLDASGNGRNFTQATSLNQPNLETAELNNLNVVHFDGANSEYLVGPDLGGIATSATLFYVVRAGADPTTGIVTGPLHFGSHAATDHYPYSDGIIYNGDCSTARKTVGDPTPALTNWNIVVTTSAPADWHYYLNGIDIFNTGTNDVGFSISPSIGVAHSGVQTNWNWTGDVAEVILYPGVLSTADRQKNEGYLAHKLGIASVLDAGHPHKSSPPML